MFFLYYANGATMPICLESTIIFSDIIAGNVWVCYVVVWWVGHSHLLYYVLLLVFESIFGVFYFQPA